MSTIETTHEEVQNMIEKFTSMLNHVRDVFINASELAQKVQGLEAKVNELTSSVEHYVNQIRTLDEALTTTRSERDTAKAQAWEAQSNLDRVTGELNALHGQYDTTYQELQRRNQEVLDLTYARDDANMEIRRLTEQLDALQRKHDDFKSHVEGLWKAVNPQPRDEGTGQFQSWPQAQVG